MMGYLFAPYRIAELAMDVERAGMEFYAYLEDKNNSGAVKNVLHSLAQQEAQHQQMFSDVMSEMKKENIEYEYPVDVSLLLQQSVENLKKSMFDLKALDPDLIDLKGCLDIAIRAEQEAIHVYSKIFQSFMEKFHEPVLVVISEEEKHLETLLQVKKDLSL